MPTRTLTAANPAPKPLAARKAALHRLVARCAADDCSVTLKLPTDGGLPGFYNGRSYDGLYLLKGGGKPSLEAIPSN